MCLSQPNQKKKEKNPCRIDNFQEQYPYPCTGCMSYITNNRALTVAAWSRAKHMDIEADSPVGIFPEDAAWDHLQVSPICRYGWITSPLESSNFAQSTPLPLQVDLYVLSQSKFTLSICYNLSFLPASPKRILRISAMVSSTCLLGCVRHCPHGFIVAESRKGWIGGIPCTKPPSEP